MISRNSLRELADALRRAGVSEKSIDIAHGILASIGQLDQSEDLPHGKSIKDWLNRAGRYPGAGSGINLIPSEHKGPCHDLLIRCAQGKAILI